MPRDINSSWKRLGRAVTLAALAVLCAAVAFGQKAGPPIVLSTGADLCHDPAIAASGNQVLAVWTGLASDGRDHVFAALSREGSWSPARRVDEAVRSECGDPAVAFSPAGVPGVAWIEGTNGSHSLRSRLAWGTIENVMRSAHRMESPSVGFASDGQPLIAWTEGEGGTFRVVLARRQAADGSWLRLPLTRGRDAYDILPTVFGGEQPSVFWYSLSSDECRLRSVEVHGNGWRSTAVPALLDTLPANRLPILYDANEPGVPGAVWVEPLSEGEIVMTFDPRRTARETIGALPRADGARQLEPDAADRGKSPAYAWREETGQGSRVLVQTAGGTVRIEGIAHVAQPRLAAAPDGGLHLVFVSDQIEGGTGQVYWVRVR